MRHPTHLSNLSFPAPDKALIDAPRCVDTQPFNPPSRSHPAYPRFGRLEGETATAAR